MVRTNDDRRITVIKPAHSADAGALATLAREAYGGCTARSDVSPHQSQPTTSLLLRPVWSWVAEDRATVVGMIVLEDAGDHLLLENVVVLPRAQGRGVGSRSLRIAEAIAAERGLPQIRLDTNEVMTENLAYYKASRVCRDAPRRERGLPCCLLRQGHSALAPGRATAEAARRSPPTTGLSNQATHSLPCRDPQSVAGGLTSSRPPNSDGDDRREVLAPVRHRRLRTKPPDRRQ
jgi:ribosomal protein S18 acetylase RimI-like enzyme